MGEIKKAIASFKALGFTPSLNNFENRLKMQKIICLLEIMGMDIGYNFGIYVRGAYSPDLTEDLYQSLPISDSLNLEGVLSASDEKILSEFKLSGILDMKSSILEIAATYADLVKIEGLRPNDALFKLKTLKPFFSEMDFVIGVNIAKELIFKPTEQELHELKSEFKSWESA